MPTDLTERLEMWINELNQALRKLPKDFQPRKDKNGIL
jgi:hypothetical protein